MDIVAIIVQLIAGAIGGNAAGAGLKKASLGSTGNSVAGAIGGIVLGQIVSRMSGGAVPADAVATSGFDIGNLVISLISSGVGGALLTAIVGLIKNR